MSDCSDMCGKKEFGVKDDTEVTDVGVPWDSRVLKVDWGRDRRTAFGEKYCFCFADVDAQFPFGEIPKKGG